ncbi:MAG: ATP synthase F1 subunit epsilon [Pirellulales bacterium]|nr:ATP synthase F1 subunit epsilon [Pirellulales bacterium]
MSDTVSNSTLRCIVVTPEETILDTEAEFVALPLFDGETGIALHHSPMIGRLGYGELRIRTKAETKRHYVDAGFVQVAGNVVSVLTNRAIPAEGVDAEVAEEQLRSALARKAAGEDQLALRDRSLSQARAQLRIARRAN